MYILKDFISNALPHSEIKTNIYRNVNNKATLEVKSSEGVPYGTFAIMIMAGIITSVVNQANNKNKKVEFVNKNTIRIHLAKTMNRFIKNCGYTPSGGKNGNIAKFKNIWKLFLASSFNFKNHNGQEINFRITQLNEEFDGYIEIDKSSYDYILNNNVYVDDEVIKKLQYGKHGCMLLNAYFWVSLRKWSLHKKTSMKYEDLQNQIGTGIKDPAVFKARIRQAFMIIASILKDDGYYINLGENALNLIDFSINEAKSKIKNFQKFLKNVSISGKHKISITFQKDFMELNPRIFV